MLNFTEHMKRIHYLADQANSNVLKGDHDTALDDLMKIGINCNEAVQQLDELMHTIKKVTAPPNGDYTMEIREHYYSSKNMLERGMVDLNKNDEDAAIIAFVAAASAVRELLSHTWSLKCKKALAAKPPKREQE